MKQVILITFALLLVAGCATKPSTTAPATLAAPVIMPPTPGGLAPLKRQSLRAMAVPVAPPTSFGDVLAPNWGVVKKFPVSSQDGKKFYGAEITWPNWPATNAYSIAVSTDLVKWTTIVISKPTPIPTIRVYDLDRPEFYRIIKAWVGNPTNPTPQ